MVESANFAYDGNAKLFLKGEPTEKSNRKMRIIRVDHLIPIAVTCEQGDETMVIPAYMDFGSNTVQITPGSLQGVDNPEEFKQALIQHITAQSMPKDTGVGISAEDIQKYQNQSMPMVSRPAPMEDQEDE